MEDLSDLIGGEAREAARDHGTNILSEETLECFEEK